MENAAVIGLGYVGQQLVSAACSVGLRVFGYDVNASVVAELNAGHSRVDDISDDHVTDMLAAGFVPSTEESVLDKAQVIVICVPTPLTADGEPDLTAVRSAARAAGRHLDRDDLVVLESTSYPGTTDSVVRPILEEISGLRAGEDFHLACSPERIDPGNSNYSVHNTPKIVGGYTPSCTAAASSFYRKVCAQVVEARSPREAEMAKLLENTYRMVNIALSNELAMVCRTLDIDPWDVIACAATKPFGFQPFYPGPGVGGHCIPIDPVYLAHHARSHGHPFRMIELAHQINTSMPGYVVSRSRSLLSDHGTAMDGARILLLGVTYKPDIADRRESPAEPIARQLRASGATVTFHDPYVDSWSVDGRDVPRVDDPVSASATADLTVILQVHSSYDLVALSTTAQLLFSTRGRLRHANGNTAEL